jgi:hypothetical protein
VVADSYWDTIARQYSWRSGPMGCLASSSRRVAPASRPESESRASAGSHATKKVLLLGAGETGKSSILKQAKFIAKVR